MSKSRPTPQAPSNRPADLKLAIARLDIEIKSLQTVLEGLHQICNVSKQDRKKMGECAERIYETETMMHQKMHQLDVFSNALSEMIEAQAAKKGGKPKIQSRKRNKSSIRQSRKVRRRRTSRTR
jgi:hypothetical protein